MNDAANKWNFRSFLSGIPNTEQPDDETDNVVHMPRQKLDVIEAAIKHEQSVIRDITKAGLELAERYNDSQMRLTNARAALIERMFALGIKGDVIDKEASSE